MACANLIVVAAALIFAFALSQSAAQTYHYSNGWNPGKKRAVSASSAIVPEALLEGADPRSVEGKSMVGGSHRVAGSGMESMILMSLLENPCSLNPEAIRRINSIIQEEVLRIQSQCYKDSTRGLKQFLKNVSGKLSEEPGKW